VDRPGYAARCRQARGRSRAAHRHRRITRHGGTCVERGTVVPSSALAGRPVAGCRETDDVEHLRGFCIMRHRVRYERQAIGRPRPPACGRDVRARDLSQTWSAPAQDPARQGGSMAPAVGRCARPARREGLQRQERWIHRTVSEPALSHPAIKHRRPHTVFHQRLTAINLEWLPALDRGSSQRLHRLEFRRRSTPPWAVKVPR